MLNHRTILAAVDLDARAPEVIRHAAKLAAFCQGRLVVAHVVDYIGGFESDHIPVTTPRRIRSDMARYARAWLVGVLHHLELTATAVEIRVEMGSRRQAIGILAAELQPCYLVVGRSLWGPLSWLATLAKDLRSHTSTELLGIADPAPVAGRGLRDRIHRWLAADAGPASQLGG